MNQLALSNDLNIITAEINSYKQVAGQAVFEIGKRLKHVKESDLVHGEWESWLSENVEMTRQHAHRFIKVYDELGTGNVTSGLHLGIKALYEIATLPAEERDKLQEIASTGELKLPNEMSVRELEEVKKSLKEAEQRAKQIEIERQLAVNQYAIEQDKLLHQIDELKSQQVRTPEDEARLDRLSSENVQLTQTVHKLQDELLERNSALEKRSHDLRKMKESLNKTRAYVEVDLSSALMYFTSISEQKDAQQVAETFWKELDETVNKQRTKWLSVLQNPVITEVEGNES